MLASPFQLCCYETLAVCHLFVEHKDAERRWPDRQRPPSAARPYDGLSYHPMAVVQLDGIFFNLMQPTSAIAGGLRISNGKHGHCGLVCSSTSSKPSFVDLLD